jgi:hypothetical protein
VPFAALLVAGAVLPPVDFDVLEYHLQVPKEWYQQGRVTFLPHNVYGNMPLGGEMVAAQAMALTPGRLAWWWGALAGKLSMACFTLLTTALLYAAGRRFFSARAGAVAALLYISTAWVLRVSINGLNEAVVAYYLFASFYTAKIWWDVRRDRTQRATGLLVLVGLLTGSAVACKYTSLLLVLVPVVLLVAWAGWPRSGRTVAVLLLAVVAACGLWLGKNWVLTGNPVYPLMYDVFGGQTRTAEKDAQWQRAHQVPRDASGNRYSLRQAGKAALEVLGGSCWQNPLIVPFAALLLWRPRPLRDVLYWALLLSFVLIAWWAATHRVPRFWVPAIPIMALLAGAGAAWSHARLWRRVANGVLTLMLTLNFVYVVAPPALADNRYLVSLDQLREDVRMAPVPGAHRPVAFDYLEQHVPPGSRVLVVGDAALFELEVPALYNTCFDDCIFESIVRNRSEQERRRLLDKLNISHVYIDWAELRRYRQPGNYGYSDYVQPQLVHGQLVAEQEILRPIPVPGLEPEDAEIFKVTSAR